MKNYPAAAFQRTQTSQFDDEAFMSPRERMLKAQQQGQADQAINHGDGPAIDERGTRDPVGNWAFVAHAYASGLTEQQLAEKAELEALFAEAAEAARNSNVVSIATHHHAAPAVAAEADKAVEPDELLVRYG